MSLSLWLNSLAVGLGTTVLALATGLFMAFVVAIAGPKVRRILLILTLVNLALPPFLTANAWLEATGNWRALAFPKTVAIASLPLTMLVLATLLWPLTTLLALGAWEKLQPAHLEADPLARGWRLINGLLLPAASSELVVAGMVTLVLALANFTVPTLFQVRVFTEEFWIRFNTEFDTVGALRATWPLVVIPAGLLVFLPRRPVAWPRREASIPAELLRQQMGVGSIPIRLIAIFWLVLALGFPLSSLAFSTRTWLELPGAVAAGGSAIATSIQTAAISATVAVGIGILATAGSRCRTPRWSWLFFLIPGVFTGVGLILVFNRPTLAAIYQGIGILWLGLILRYLAPGWALIAAATRSADTGLVDAARSLGASRWRVVRDVLIPQVWRGIAAAWLAVYLLCLWDVETVVLIQPPGGETLALRIFNLLHYGHAGQVNALCLIMLGLAAAPVALGLAWDCLRRRRRPTFSGSVPLAALIAGLSGIFTAGCSKQSDGAVSSSLNSKFFARAEIIGSRGVAPGQFNKPRSLACDREDNLYVADITGRIQKFSPDGKFRLQWQMPQTDLGKPKGMGLDHDGDIVVIEPHYMRVNHFTTEGKLVAQWGVKGTNWGQFILPRSFAQNSRGEFYVSEYTVVDRVQRFSPEVKLKAQSSKLPSDGTAFVAFPPRETLLTVWGGPGTADGEFNRAEGLGIGPRDEVFVADSCNHRIQVFDREGKFLRSHGRAGSNPGEFSYPYDVRVDNAGNQFVCEFGNSRITVLNANDQVIEVIGHPGAEPGTFANPWAIALDSKGNLYVADSQNHRVQKLVRRK